jgi:hypothetical protein
MGACRIRRPACGMGLNGEVIESIGQSAARIANSAKLGCPRLSTHAQLRARKPIRDGLTKSPGTSFLRISYGLIERLAVPSAVGKGASPLLDNEDLRP